MQALTNSSFCLKGFVYDLDVKLIAPTSSFLETIYPIIADNILKSRVKGRQ